MILVLVYETLFPKLSTGNSVKTQQSHTERGFWFCSRPAQSEALRSSSKLLPGEHLLSEVISKLSKQTGTRFLMNLSLSELWCSAPGTQEPSDSRKYPLLSKHAGFLSLDREGCPISQMYLQHSLYRHTQAQAYTHTWTQTQAILFLDDPYHLLVPRITNII